MTDSSVGTILNVNDDEASLHANSRVLTSAGYRVIEARTGKDALRAAVREQPALILLDARLPDIPGAEVCRLLKSDPATSQMMVLFLSARETGSHAKARGRQRGADGYLTGPIEAGELVASVKALLRRLRTKERAKGRLLAQSQPKAVHKQTEWDVDDTEARYRMIAEMAHQGLWLIDSQGRTLFANRRMADMLGCGREDLLNRSVTDYCFVEDIPQAREWIARSVSGESKQFDFRFKRSDGAPVLVLGETSPIQENDDHPKGALGMFADITVRKQAEERLRESRERLQYALESADMVAWDWIPDTDVMIQSSNASAVLGLPSGDTLHSGQDYFAMIHQEDQPRIVAAVQRALRKGADYHEEFRLVLGDGSIRWVADRGRVTMNENGKAARMNGVIRDITELKSRDMAVRESEARFRATFHQAAVGMCLISPEGRLLQVNQKLCELLDEPTDGLTNRNLLDVTYPDDRAHNKKSMSQLLLGGVEDISVEQRLVRRDGRPMWVSIYLALLLDAGGRIEHVIGVIQDIDERKRAEEALRESDRRFREMIDALPAAIYTTDDQGRITHFNQAAVEFSGRVPELGTDQWCVSWKLYRPDGTPLPHDECPMAIALKEGRIVRGIEALAERPDGKRMWFTPYPTPLRDSEGRITGGINMLVDITERKQGERQLSQLNAELERRVAERTRDLVYSQNRLRKLASDLSLTEERERRRVAGELHDYLAQLLVATRMKLTQARQSRQASKQSDLLNDVDHMLDQSLTYTRTLVAQLSPPVLHEFGLAAALKWLGEQMARHGLHVTTEIEGEPVPLSEEQAVLLFQSVRELLFNVLKHAGTDRASLQLNSTGSEMGLTVIDDGCGFDSSARKEAAASDGKFGLFSIRERMESLGGRVDLVSQPGGGTRVTLSIPAFSMSDSPSMQSEPGRAPALTKPASKDRQVVGRLRIVLVDDHAMVRQGLRSVLESHDDVEVIAEAGDGLQAVALTELLRPDVVVMDLTLPHIDGVEATRRICEANPSTVVIGLSVHPSWQVEQAIKGAGAAAFLTKECAADQLYEAITAATMARSS